MEIIDGKKISQLILDEIRTGVAKLTFQPIFCDVLVGQDAASMQYVRMKARTAESVGIKFHNATFPASISTEELIDEIQKLNAVPYMCGIIIQLPLPEGIDKRAVLDAIDPTLDVDCLGAVASERFYNGESSLGFPTALACMAVLNTVLDDLTGKNVTVMGQGELVGKPVAALLKHRNIQPNLVIKTTENKEEILKQSDVIISGMGQGKYITGEMIKDGAVLIDAGTSEENNAIVGDVDFESVSQKSGFISPVPGGVGPVTVAMLLNNVLTVAMNKS